MAHDSALSARSSGWSSMGGLSSCTLPSRIVTLPSRRATRRRKARAGVLRDRCASEKPTAAVAASTAVRSRPLRLNEVADEHGERTPGGREPEVGVNPAAEELEVVAQHEQRPDGDEHE